MGVINTPSHEVVDKAMVSGFFEVADQALQRGDVCLAGVVHELAMLANGVGHFWASAAHEPDGDSSVGAVPDLLSVHDCGLDSGGAVLLAELSACGHGGVLAADLEHSLLMRCSHLRMAGS